MFDSVLNLPMVQEKGNGNSQLYRKSIFPKFMFVIDYKQNEVSPTKYMTIDSRAW